MTNADPTRRRPILGAICKHCGLAQQARFGREAVYTKPESMFQLKFYICVMVCVSAIIMTLGGTNQHVMPKRPQHTKLSRGSTPLLQDIWTLGVCGVRAGGNKRGHDEGIYVMPAGRGIREFFMFMDKLQTKTSDAEYT